MKEKQKEKESQRRGEGKREKNTLHGDAAIFEDKRFEDMREGEQGASDRSNRFRSDLRIPNM